MSLDRVGNSPAMNAIQKRIREIQTWLKAHPEEAAQLDAKIDADREKIAALTNGATHAHAESKPAPGKFSRESMRLGVDREHGDLL